MKSVGKERAREDTTAIPEILNDLIREFDIGELPIAKDSFLQCLRRERAGRLILKH